MSESRFALHVGDALDVLRTLDAGSCDALVTDPPAGIAFMGAKWDRNKGGRAQWVAWLAEILTEVRRVLKPGAHALVWALPRTAHWTATAVEDAGFLVRDVVVHLQGQGFPKSKSLLKPAAEHWILARAPGPLRELGIDACRIGTTKETPASQSRHESAAANGWGFTGADPASGGYDAHLGRWPANAVLSHAEGCEQIGSRKIVSRAGHQNGRHNGYAGGLAPRDALATAGCAEIREGTKYMQEETVGAWRCADGCPVAELDAQGAAAGMHSAGTATDGEHCRGNGSAGYSGGWKSGPAPRRGDGAAASRFFYCAKASTADRSENLDARNPHPTVKNTELMRWLCRLVTPPGGLILDPFTGSGSTGVAALLEGFRFVGVEREEKYAAIARQRIANALGPLFASAVGGGA